MKQINEHTLDLVHVQCCICNSADAKLIGTGLDFEYKTSSDIFSAVQCNACDLIYLNPRPNVSEFGTIYPGNYHAYDFSPKDFGLVYKIRSWLETRRLLSWCKGLPGDARILDIGCGDGFHLNLLAQNGKKTWTLEGIDMNSKAIEMAKRSGLLVHYGTVETVNLPDNHYDLAFIVQTIEHVENPNEVLRSIYRLLKPGGKLVIVTDNTDSVDCRFFKRTYWGGYHFPRHWNLFNRKSLTRLAEKNNFQIDSLITQVSPVNWVYTIHNWLVDKNAPGWLINRFTLKSTVSLGVFTMLDIVLQKFNNGALLRAILKKPVH